MPQHIYTEDHLAFRDSVATFVDRVLRPRAQEMIDAHTIPRDIWAEAGRQGLFGLCIPEEYGGAGVEDYRFNAIAAAEEARFTQAVADAAAQVKIGPGMDPATQLGPLVSQEQFDKVTGYLAAGIADGARALTGGGRWGETGYFVEPTVFVDVKPEFSIVREEIFGPVVAALPFNAEEGVAAAANDSIYGLAAGIWTKDISKAHRTAREIKAGSMWINQYNGFDTAMPFGGYKQSGWGRELGANGIDAYTTTKSVNVAL